MNVSCLWRGTQGQETPYCRDCGEKLGAGPAWCDQCGAWRANPQATARSLPPPVSTRRKAISLLLPLVVAAMDRHSSWQVKIWFFACVAGACIFALPITLGMAWAKRKNGLDWRTFFSVAEKLIGVCILAYLTIALLRPSGSQMTSCYGACTARVGDVSASVLIAVGGLILAVLVVVALLVTLRKRTDARLPAVDPKRVSQGSRGRLTSREPWSVPSREQAGKPVRHR